MVSAAHLFDFKEKNNMKKALSLLLVLAMTFSLCIGLISCGNSNNPGGDNPSANNPGDDNPSADNPGGDNPSADKPFSVDLAGYVANIGNATALGISKKAKASVSPMASYGTKNSGVQLLSYNTLASDKDTEDKNYIVMSTTDYDANAPETNETGLTKVTFTKIVTENVTTEMNGEKLIKAHKDGLSFHAVEGFTYSVYDGDTLIYEGVRDNDANDADNKTGKILLTNATDKVYYTVKYSGIGVETTITQDDINGEIDKLYVLNGYTFISFVPMGQSLRPDDNQMNYDSNGVAFYDKVNYFSNNSRQSFVINNATGYVYQIKDVSLDEIKNNLIIISGKIYDMRITDNGELQFFTVVRNETLVISDYHKDIYGNKYIENNELDVFDEENNTVYYTKNKNQYLFSNEGVAIKVITEIIRNDRNDYIRTERKYYKITDSFAEVSIGNDEKFLFTEKINESPKFYAIIEEGYFYMVSEDAAYRVNLENFEIEESPSPFYYTGQNGFYFDHKTVVTYHYAKYGDTVYNLYFANLYGENALPHDDAFYYDHNLDMGTLAEKFLDDVKLERVGDLFSINGWKFKKTTLTETVFYQIIVGDDGNPKIVDETYVAPEREVITLQPLNK